MSVVCMCNALRGGGRCMWYACVSVVSFPSTGLSLRVYLLQVINGVSASPLKKWLFERAMASKKSKLQR